MLAPFPKWQVISFQSKSDLDPQTYVKALNYYLPEAISVKKAFLKEDDFDVRRDALSREYRYNIINSTSRSPLERRYAYHVPSRMDIPAMNRACQYLLGEHDFASFATSMNGRKLNTVRTVYKANVSKEDEKISFDISANSFLPHQVRNTVGVLIKIGTGKMQVDELHQIAASRTPGSAGPAAPACGLCLMMINYPHPLGEFNG